MQPHYAASVASDVSDDDGKDDKDSDTDDGDDDKTTLTAAFNTASAFVSSRSDIILGVSFLGVALWLRGKQLAEVGTDG